MSFINRHRGAFVALVLVAAVTSVEAAPCDGRANDASILERGAPLTLEAALNEIRRASPAVRAAGLEARALAAEADQAARPHNPSLSVELDNFAGTGNLSGFDQTETTVAIEQTFQLGGKRSLGERAARARQALATAECVLILREARTPSGITVRRSARR